MSSRRMPVMPGRRPTLALDLQRHSSCRLQAAALSVLRHPGPGPGPPPGRAAGDPPLALQECDGSRGPAVPLTGSCQCYYRTSQWNGTVEWLSSLARLIPTRNTVRVTSSH